MKKTIRLINTTGKSNKFWNADLNETTVIVTYGRIGTSGSTKKHEFYDKWEAQSFLDKKTNEKLRKGYKHVVDDRQLEIREQIAASIGTTNKVDRVAFLHITEDHAEVISSKNLNNPDYSVGVYVILRVRSTEDEPPYVHYFITEDKVLYATTYSTFLPGTWYPENFKVLEDGDLKEKLEGAYSLALENFTLFG